MVYFASPSVMKMHKVPDGAFRVKMLGDVVAADVGSPIASNVFQTGWGGAGNLAFVAVMQGAGTTPTGLDAFLQGRTDDKCAWVDLLNITQATTLLAGKVFVLRNNGTNDINMMWPELRIALDDQTGGTTPPTMDYWIMGSMDGAK